MYVDSTDFVYHSPRIEFRGLLPEIIRKLIRNTTTGITKLEFPSGDAIEQPGWDGIVEVQEGNDFVPNGISAWEVSTQSNIDSKANADYEKRKEDPKGLEPKVTTFIFVTSRKWPKKEEWIRKRNEEKFWKNVKAIDANNLEDWLKSNLSVHVWLSIVLGKYSENAVDLSNYWLDWSESTRPNLNAEFILSGRESLVEEIQAALKSFKIVSLRSNSKSESVVVFTALLNHLPGNESMYHLMNSIIVHDINTWNKLAITKGSLILIPMFDDPLAISRAVRFGHKVIIPLGKDEPLVENEIKIPELSIEKASKILKSIGIPSSDCNSMAILARRDLQSFMLKITLVPESFKPRGLSPEGSELIPSILLGSWNESFKGDQDSISNLSQMEYSEYIASINHIINTPGTPINRFGNIYKIGEREKTLIQYYSSVTPSQALLFRDIAIDVLSTQDPKYDLTIDKRWMSAAYGALPEYSGILVEGIAETLAILSSNIEAIPSLGTDSCNVIVNTILDRLFRKLNVNWKAWASLSSSLPLLAEASPDLLLSAIDRGLAQDPPIFKSLFTDSGDPTFTSSPHTGLLWALETLAWNPEYLGYSSLLLLRLAKIDPGGSYTNRPINSLFTIFNLLIPHSLASLEQRFDVIDTLLENENEVAWVLLLKLVPDRRIITPTRKPKWQKWVPEDRENITQSEVLQGLRLTISRLIENANHRGNRLADLISILSNLPQPYYQTVYTYLKEIQPERIEEKIKVWNGLRDLISRHRSYPDAVWSLDEEKLSSLQEIYERLEPESYSAKYSWLFSQTPSLLDGTTIGREAYFEIIEERRMATLSEIYESERLDGIISLIDEVESPRSLGYSLSNFSLTDEEERSLLITKLASETPSNLEFSKGYIFGLSQIRSRDEILTIFESIQSELTDAQKGYFLTTLPLDLESWDFVHGLGSSAESEYWRRINPYAIPDYLTGAKKLIENDLPYSAIGLLAIHLKSDEPFDQNVSLSALEKALSISPEADSPLQSLGYHISSLFTKLEETSGVDLNRLAILEWHYLPIIQRHQESETLLHLELARNPEFCNQVIKFVYSSSEDEQKELSEEDKVRARRGFQLLESWRTIPGTTPEGINIDTLRSWIIDARRLNSESGRQIIGDQIIGKMLSNSPPDESRWPHPTICTVLEELANPDIEAGFEIGLFNSRGAFTKSPLEGGKQEMELSEKYAKFASDIRDIYPRTSSLLRRISSQYKVDARREDLDVEKRYMLDN